MLKLGRNFVLADKTNLIHKVTYSRSLVFQECLNSSTYRLMLTFPLVTMLGKYMLSFAHASNNEFLDKRSAQHRNVSALLFF